MGEKPAKPLVMHNFLRIAILVVRIACDHPIVWNGPCNHDSRLMNGIALVLGNIDGFVDLLAE